MTQQLDIFAQLEANDRAERTAHLPRTFTSGTDFTAAELSGAYLAWCDENGRFGCVRRSHMWHPAICDPFGTDKPHSVWVLNADLRCDHHGESCSCLGDYLTRVYCSDCQWWSQPAAEEGTAVREYHDHCWPGWRDLPLCTRPNLDKPPKLPADYPEEWRVPGAPILTHRTSPGTRNVPGRSPFGGYDMTAPECLEKD